jgi:hypothetical protein
MCTARGIAHRFAATRTNIALARELLPAVQI